MYLKSLKAEMFVSNLTDELEKAKRVVSLAIERAKRSLEMGRNAALVIDDVLSVSSLDNAEMTIIKNLMSLTKCAKKGSITLFAVMPSNFNFGVFEKLADKRLKINSNQIIELN